MAYNINSIRENFPILKTLVYNKPLVYFDNAATTQKPECVIRKIAYMYEHCNANVHRGVHYLSAMATDEMEAARETVRQFLNARNSYEIVFTRGTTEAINLVAFSFAEAFLSDGDEIIVTEMEHHSNLVPWQMACQRRGAKLVKWPINNKGELVAGVLPSLITGKTRLLALGHVSNALGSINPVKEIIAEAHKHGIVVLVDGAQAVQHLSVDVQDLDCDFYTFSSHKIYGPTGIGVLYGKEEWLEKLPPYQGGGEMISKVSFEKSEYNSLPFKFEAGTPDYVGAAALGEALRYIDSIGIGNIAAHEAALLDYATSRLLETDGLIIYGTADKKCSLISFLVKKHHPYDQGVLLDQMGFATRTGTHCAETVMQHFGIAGTIRVSFGLYNTFEEIDRFADAMQKADAMLS